MPVLRHFAALSFTCVLTAVSCRSVTTPLSLPTQGTGAGAATANKPKASNILLIRNVSIAPDLPPHTVRVQDGIITAIGPDDNAIPVGHENSGESPQIPRTIDGSGHFLAPGLTDMHVHLGFRLGGDRPVSEHELATYLAYGVTTIVNQGDFGSPLGAEITALANKVERGEIVGPTLYTASYVRGPNDGRDFQEVRTEEDGRQLVEASKAAGYDFMKVYHTVPEVAFRGVAAAAKEKNMAILAHPILGIGLAKNLEIGIDMIAHAESYTYSMFDNKILPERLDDAVELTRQYQPYIATTLRLEKIVLELALGGPPAIEAFLAAPEMAYVHPQVIANWHADHFPRWLDPSRLNQEKIDTFAFIKAIFLALHTGGARFVLGTDGPVVASAPGINVHQEMAFLATLGLSPAQIQEIASANPGSFLQQHRVTQHPLGKIEVGAQADLVLLRADPRVDISNYQHIEAVISDGRVFNRAHLDQLLARAKAFNDAERASSKAL